LIIRQIIRCILTFVLFIGGIIYCFIYVFHLPFILNFWAYLFTFLAMFNIFVGQGKQLCYHQNVKIGGKFDFEDLTLKNKMWLSGSFWYSIAIPTAIMSSFLYFVSFQDLYNWEYSGCVTPKIDSD
jgi:hypothetical protein